MKSLDFQVKFNTQAAKDLRKLSRKAPSIIPSLVKAIDSLSPNPYKGKTLKGNKKGCYSYRSGDYRIIYEIYQLERIVHIIRVGNRREVYR